MERLSRRRPLSLLLDNHRAFLRYLTQRVGDRALGEDILQDAFEAFARELETRDSATPEMAGEICGCVSRLAPSASNAAVRVFRARAALKRRVTESCGTCAEHGCIDCTCRTNG